MIISYQESLAFSLDCWIKTSPMKQTIIKELNCVDFEEKISGNSGFMIIEYWNKDSGTCDIMEPVYKKLAEEYHECMEFYRCHLDLDYITLKNHKIIGIPSYSIYRDKQLIDIVHGIVPFSKFYWKLSAYSSFYEQER